jgi:hypothetical protein
MTKTYRDPLSNILSAGPWSPGPIRETPKGDLRCQIVTPLGIPIATYYRPIDVRRTCAAVNACMGINVRSLELGVITKLQALADTIADALDDGIVFRDDDTRRRVTAALAAVRKEG